MAHKSQSQLLKDLNLLVSAGLGVAPIAPALSELMRQIIGAVAGGMCWFSKHGIPEGFYHYGSPPEAQELFMNNYKELFAGPHEYTPFWSMGKKTSGVINSVYVSKQYLRSNTFNLLIKPSHCYFLLYVLVDLDGVTRLSACFFRTIDNPFSDGDTQKLTGLIPVLRRGLGKFPNAMASQKTGGEGGYMVVSSDGKQVQMIDAGTDKLLATV